MSAGLLLCAGGSKRFTSGQHKLLAPFRGRPLVSWALEHACDAHFDQVFVVVGSIDLSTLLDGVTIVENAEWASGLASSLRAGISAAEQHGHDAVVVGLGDQPLVPAAAWAEVAASDSPIAVANFGGQRTPPVRLSREVWDLLPNSGDFGARELLRARPDLVRDVACMGNFIDVDTDEDLARWNRTPMN